MLSGNALIHSGIYKIFVSLNGSTEEVNRLSRQGYDEAINALSVLKQADFYNYAINYVVSKRNIDNLPQMLKLAEKYKVKELYILMKKADRFGQLTDVLSKNDLEFLCSFYKNYNGPVKIIFDICFVQLNLLYNSSLLSAKNFDKYIGCPAGKYLASINVGGSFSPCRHIFIKEKFLSFSEFWNKSVVLEKIRKAELLNDKCNECNFFQYCRPCYAIFTAESKQKNAVEKYCPMQII